MRAAVIIGIAFAVLIVGDLVFNDAQIAHSVQAAFTHFMVKGVD